jgi:hypothetical protein
MNISRIALGVGVDKHGALRLAKPLGEFRSKLVASDNLHVVAGELPAKPAARVPAEPVIAPQGVPITDDESSG